MSGTCKKCNAKVGCSCQLKDGMCPTCYANSKKK